MARIIVAQHDFYRAQPVHLLGAGRHQQARILEQLFPQRQPPPPPALQLVGADIDHDGDEDKTAIQMLPLTPAAGVAFTAGQSIDFELKPLRLFQLSIVSVEDVLAASFVVTSFTIGQEDLFVAKGGVPLSAFSNKVMLKELRAQWAGPGVPINLTIKSIEASAAKTLFGVIFGTSVIG
jgi:hypothetical protein